MPLRILFPDFREQQSPSKYPFGDACTLTSPTTGQTIDYDTLLDAALYPLGAVDGVHLSRVEVSASEIALVIGDRLTTDLAEASFNPVSPPDIIEFRDIYSRPAGVLVSESLRLARFAAWDTGDHTFGLEDTEFVASCVIPTPATGVHGFLSGDGDLVSGDIWLVGDNGIVLRNDGDGNIRVDAVGDPLFVRRLCIPLGEFAPPSPIKTINGCGPDEFGNFNLVVGDNLAADTIMRINPTADGTALVISAVGQLVRSKN